ncbi:MAG: hypothetical protein ACJ76S_06810 [Solirubrobacteraceae bacterium]
MLPGRAVVTTVVRGATLREPSGWLRVVDLAERRVEASAPVPDSPLRRRDPNPRGGLRGATGLSAHDGRLVVAGTDALFVLDHGWALVDRLTHPWLGGVHGILAEPDAIWATSTSADLLLALGWRGEVLDSWCWRADTALRQELGFDDLRDFDPDRDYRDPLTTGGSFNVAHVNAVARAPEGLVVSLGRLLARRALRRQRMEGIVVHLAELTSPSRSALRAVRRRREGRYPGRRRGERPRPESQHAVVTLEKANRGWSSRVVMRTTDTAVPNHDALIEGDRLLYTDSNMNRLVAIDRHTGSEIAAVGVPGSPSFARGVVQLAGESFLVGSQLPAAIYRVDMAAGLVIDAILLSDDPRETVFAIALVPDGFTPPGRDLTLTI